MIESDMIKIGRAKSERTDVFEPVLRRSTHAAQRNPVGSA